MYYFRSDILSPPHPNTLKKKSYNFEMIVDLQEFEIYIYIYIYINVKVCVCREREQGSHAPFAQHPPVLINILHNYSTI